MRTTFVQDDIATLRRAFIVDEYIGSGVAAVIRNVTGAARADVSFCWFGSVYSFFVVLGARLAGKKAVIMLGGVDTARDQGLNYGIWLSRWKSFLLRRALRWAHRVFMVDDSMRGELLQLSGWDGASLRVLPTGYDAEFWSPAHTAGVAIASQDREKTILCVASCNSMQRVQVKGVDLLLQAARLLPFNTIIIIGIEPDIREQLAADTPSNVQLLPPVPRTHLVDYYRTATVYCQPSRREGLPNTLCEAMLCACIPVGAAVGGIPGAIGTTGYVVEKEDVEGLAAALAAALAEAGEEKGKAARQRIAEMFPKGLRERRLVEELTRLAHA